MELFHGSPDNMEGRQDREVRAYKLLDELGVDFVRTDHFDEPATSMEACEKIDAILNVRICKNLFLCNRQKTNFYLLIMPGDKPFKTKELSGQLGISRLSFGEPEYMEKYLDRPIRLPSLRQHELDPLLDQGPVCQNTARHGPHLHDRASGGVLRLGMRIKGTPSWMPLIVRSLC